MTQQETVDDLVARFRQALEQREIKAREWERQAEQLSASLNAARTKLDAAMTERRSICDILSADSVTVAGQTLADALLAVMAHRDAAERRLGEALTALSVAEEASDDARTN